MVPRWGGKARCRERRHRGVRGGAGPAVWPALVTATRDAAFSELSGRIRSYAPEWSSQRSGDAGVALARLFSEEIEPVLQRLNQLPENSFIRVLQSGGIQPRPPTPATAVLQFAVSTSATQSVH